MDLASFFPQVEESSAWLRERVGEAPRMIVVLSAGLESFVDDMEGVEEIDSSEIPHFPRARAEGHRGRIAFGRMKGVPLVTMEGRFHFYV